MASLSIPSVPGNERLAADQVLSLLEKLDLDAALRKRIETAVAETVMNAIEHGNQFNARLAAQIDILAGEQRLTIKIADRGGGREDRDYVIPDLYAKLHGEQSPRGWGLFLIKNMVDEFHETQDGETHAVELIFNIRIEKNDPSL
jgi:anti-sigma regulatory factor (Ser/Thr protein kinase)